MNKEYVLTTPNKALEDIRDFLVDNNWTIMNNCTPDLALDAGQTFNVSYVDSDGKEQTLTTSVPNEYYDGTVLAAQRDDVIIVMRTVNGLRVLPTQEQQEYLWAEDIGNPKNFLNRELNGIVMTSCTAYTSNPSSGLWYDQTNPITNESDEVIGVYLPIQNLEKLVESKKFYTDKYTHKMIINYTEFPEISCVISVENIAIDIQRTHGVEPMIATIGSGIYDIVYHKVYCHIAFCNIQKIGTWDGGTCISGTLNSSDTDILSDFYEQIEPPKNKWLGCVLKYSQSIYGGDGKCIERMGNLLYGMAENSSTFCRIDVDGAPVRKRPVLWASAGPRTGTKFSTGKTLGLSVARQDYFDQMPKVPHFCNIQSKGMKDYGRNANTLNDISVDLPIYVYILRDPDVLENYSQIGYIPNVYHITMKNIAEAKKYKFDYPNDEEHQVFPHVCRRGQTKGYDGFSVAQELPLDD